MRRRSNGTKEYILCGPEVSRHVKDSVTEKAESGSYAATKFERTSLSGRVTAFTLDSLALQAYQVFTVMYLENYILKMIRHQTVRFKFYKHIFFL